MSERFFRATRLVYEHVCDQLDAAYGYPNAETKTLRALPPANELPTDNQGRVYLSVSVEYCEFILPSQMLPQLLASGAVEEIGETTYLSTLPQPPLA